MLKLNLGCGFKKKEDFINVDISAQCDPDIVCDLATEVWPWQNNTVDEVHFDLSLEQMGETKKSLLYVIQELYRVCKSEALVNITYAHPRHDQFFLNPLCVHRLSPEFFAMLSVQNNLQMIARGDSDTCLAFILGVNFEMTNVTPFIATAFMSDFQAGRITEQEIIQRSQFENNICQVVTIQVKVIKNDSSTQVP